MGQKQSESLANVVAKKTQKDKTEKPQINTQSTKLEKHIAMGDKIMKTSTPKKILIIAGGANHERDVSLRTGSRVCNILKNLGHTVKTVDLNQETIKSIKEYNPDLIWPLLHGDLGEDGSLHNLLEILGYPYVGSSARACTVASSKPLAKTKIKQSGMTTPDFISLPQKIFKICGATQTLKLISEKLGYPLVIKPSIGGSALGVSFATDEKTLREAMVDAFMYGQQVIIEKAVKGIELAITVIEFDGQPKAMPIVEISPREGDYDFDARYIVERTEYFTPARITDQQAEKVKKYAEKVHKILGLRDLSRIDVIMDEKENIWFFDANVTPGMTDTSLLPQAANAYSSFEEIIEHIVQIKR